MNLRLAIGCAAWLGACGGATSGPARPTAAPATASSGKPDKPVPPGFRLPAGVRPERVLLDLTVVPGEPTLSGHERIELALGAPAPVVWLHATELTITGAELDGRPARVVPAPPELVGFVPERPLPAGKAVLSIAWQAPMDKVRSRAVYQVAEGNDWYAYTFFEPIDARRAWPCFDEPGFKVPWELVLHVKKEHVALANTAVVRERDEDGGMKAVTFAETRPLPSYLVAFIVGPFDLVAGPPAGRQATPFRIAVPRGRGAETRWALEATPKIIALEEDYFGIPYPWGKLDVAVVPRFWGTMEHPGLVALGQPLTLIRPEDDSVGRRQGYANIAAHELAHYWFGDLVTMAWWDDTWLNEALAQWIDARITDAVEPRWSFLRGRQANAGWTMAMDGHPSARAIRQPVTSRTEIEASFDGAITYSKGSLVLSMFEAFAGPERFQKTIHDYLSAHMWGSARADDFYGALRDGLGDDVATAFQGFIEQPGVPQVTAELACGKRAPPTVTLSQRRFLPLGARAAEVRWKIPVCLAWGTAKVRSGSRCLLLGEATAPVSLEGQTTCPEWVLANAGAAGYYRALHQGKLLPALLDRAWERLSAAERVRVVSDVGAQVMAGVLPAGEALALVPRLAREPSRDILSVTQEILRVARADLLPADLRPNLQRFIRKVYGKRARALGWSARANEPADTQELRAMLLGALGNGGEDVEIIAQARQRLDRWLDDRKSLDANLVHTVLAIAARHGDRKLWERLRDAATKTGERRERVLLLGALGMIPDPELAREGLRALESGAFELRDAQGFWQGLLLAPETREVAYEALKRSFDGMSAKLRQDDLMLLFHVPSMFCDEPHIADARAFFGERAKKVDGAENALANALDEATQCAAVQAAQKESVEGFLKKY